MTSKVEKVEDYIYSEMYKNLNDLYLYEMYRYGVSSS